MVSNPSDPSGQWKFNGNGFTGVLNITVDNQGNVTGDVIGNPITGFYDKDAGRIIFLRIIDTNNPSTYQIYTGYIRSSLNQNDFDYVFDGYFEAFSGTGAVARRPVYGWDASNVVIH
jgi:hypothetical protein